MDDIPSQGTKIFKIDEPTYKATLQRGVVVQGSIATDIYVAWLTADGAPYIDRESGIDVYEKAEDAITAYLRREESRLRRQLRDMKLN